MARRIREEREKQKMSARSLAAAANVSASAVSMWEDGTTKNLRPENLLAVADVLGVSIRWLITGRGPKNNETHLHAAEEQGAYKRLSAEGVEMCQQWEKLPREAREQANQFIYMLIIMASLEPHVSLKNMPKNFSEFEKILSRSILHKKPSKAA